VSWVLLFLDMLFLDMWRNQRYDEPQYM